MARQLSVLSRLRVASPCAEPWAGMSGDERVRHCARCNLNVYNLTEMTRAEAEALILAREGRLCVRYAQRHDGTILTRDCPVGVSLVRRKVAKTLGMAAAAFAFVAGGLHALARGERGSQQLRLRYFRPFQEIAARLTPAPKSMEWIAGAFDLGEISHEKALVSPESAYELRTLIEAYKSAKNQPGEKP